MTIPHVFYRYQTWRILAKILLIITIAVLLLSIAYTIAINPMVLFNLINPLGIAGTLLGFIRPAILPALLFAACTTMYNITKSTADSAWAKAHAGNSELQGKIKPTTHEPPVEPRHVTLDMEPFLAILSLPSGMTASINIPPAERSHFHIGDTIVAHCRDDYGQIVEGTVSEITIDGITMLRA